MGDRNLESLSKDPDLARSIASRENLTRIYGFGIPSRLNYETGLRVQAEIRDTGTSPEVAGILEPLGEAITNLPGTLTPDEKRVVRENAGDLEAHVGGLNLLPVVLTWVMREPVRKGEVSLDLMQKRPAQPKTLAQTLRDLADSLDGGNLPPSSGDNIKPFRRPTP